MNQQKSKGPKSIPTQIQLFGGAVLKGMPFKIVEFHPDGTPKLFELQADGSFDIKKASTRDGTCVLFASEELLRTPWREKDASSGT